MNYQERIADQRNAYLLALEVLSIECSASAIERAAKKLETDSWWREGDEERANFAAREMRALLENKRDALGS